STKFDEDGLSFKAKLIGIEDVPKDRDEKVCLDSMFKLKAVAKALANARGEHKQKIEINLTLLGVKLYEESTKKLIISHEIERISFVVTDPKDSRAFGYIYNTRDDQHRFYAMKMERPAALIVVLLKELFDTAFEQFKNNTETAIVPKQNTRNTNNNIATGSTLTSAESSSIVPKPTATTSADKMKAEPVPASTTISPFYIACRNNNVELVKELLKTMTSAAISRIEPNGSTALHIASYKGHKEIVELLLQKGANHAIINKYNCTPLQEAKTDEIKQLIITRRKNTRFCCEMVEWILATNDADYQAHEYWKKLELYVKDPKFYQFIRHIKRHYIEKELKDIDGIDTIRQYFDRALTEDDPLYLIKAYTADTGFYYALNAHLAQLHLDNLTAEDNLSRAYLIAIIARHPKFD
ncbi:unnamed protein product, partial [Didymodactylos carnosus]